MLVKIVIVVQLVAAIASSAFAKNIAVINEPVIPGKFVSSLMYGHIKSTDDFDSRGRVDFKAHSIGARFNYGVSERTAVAIQGGSYVDPELTSRGSRWSGQSGYFYGLDLYNEIFPATSVWPGLQGQLGVLGYQAGFNRLYSGGTTILINQIQRGIEYHGALLGIWKISNVSPYLGLRAFGSSVKWRDNEFSTTGLSKISGNAHGNITIVAGTSLQCRKDLRLNIEGRFINETAISAGIQTSVF